MYKLNRSRYIPLLLATVLLMYYMFYFGIYGICLTSTLQEPASKLRVAWFTAGLAQGYFGIVQDQLKQTEANFCTDRPWVETHYYVFTDQTELREDLLFMNDKITLIHVERRGWPYDSDGRFDWMVKVTYFYI